MGLSRRPPLLDLSTHSSGRGYRAPSQHPSTPGVRRSALHPSPLTALRKGATCRPSPEPSPASLRRPCGAFLCNISVRTYREHLEDLLQMDDDLFAPGITHIEVKCWDCGHTATRRPEDVPNGIGQHDFERRSVCKCGTRWPQVTRYPRKKSTSM